MDHTSASEQNMKETESSTSVKKMDIVNEPSTSGLNLPARRCFSTHTNIHILDEPSTSGLNLPAGRSFSTQTNINMVDGPSTSGLNRPAGRSITTFKKIEIMDLPSFSGLKLPTERDFITHKGMDIMDLASTHALYLQGEENSTTHRSIRMDQSTSGFNLQAGDSNTTHKNVEVMVQPSKPGLNKKLTKCSLSTNQHFSTSTMSTAQSKVRSKIPVPIRKSNIDEGFSEPMDADSYRVQPRICDTIKELPEPFPDMSSDEEEEAYVRQMSTIGDIQNFHNRFTNYYEQMRNLDQSRYQDFGMTIEYERLNEQLILFLGELCYYREKKE